MKQQAIAVASLSAVFLQVATLLIEDTNYRFKKGEPYLEPFPGIPYDLILTNLSGSFYEDSLSRLPNCQRLEIYDSIVDEIEDGGLCSQRLRVLCMENNVLPEFSAGIFSNCSRLETLDLRDNNFTLAHDAFDAHLANLKELIVVDGSVAVISKSLFENLVSLETLKLYLYGLRAIEAGALDNLQQLSSLFLSGSHRLTSIDGVFLKLSKLEKLKVAHNGLESFPWDELRAVPRLSHLDIEGNEVRKIRCEAVVKYAINLRYLNVRNNSVSCADYLECDAVIGRGLKIAVKLDKQCENGTK